MTRSSRRALRFDTDPSAIEHPVARETLTILRDLRRRVRQAQPRPCSLPKQSNGLKIRAILVGAKRRPGLARARQYRCADGTGARLRRARLPRNSPATSTPIGRGGPPQTEGVVDAEGQSIEIVTIHSSKGLEWPVVIPINMASGPRSQESFVHRRQDDTLHWMLGDIVPPSLAGAMQSEAQEEAQQRLRLLYVACTRAMDLLVLPELSWSELPHGRARLISG